MFIVHPEHQWRNIHSLLLIRTSTRLKLIPYIFRNLCLNYQRKTSGIDKRQLKVSSFVQLFLVSITRNKTLQSIQFIGKHFLCWKWKTISLRLQCCVSLCRCGTVTGSGVQTSNNYNWQTSHFCLDDKIYYYYYNFGFYELKSISTKNYKR